jgi:hypothetical protein
VLFIAACTDGSHVLLAAPSINEPQYVDRNGNHSINCQFTCGRDYTFFDEYVDMPGSVNDSRMMQRSRLFDEWENRRPFPSKVILGDSGSSFF